jgi:hypothetical protein
MKNLLKILGSLKLCCVLLSLGVLLIFVATLDQSQNGLRHALNNYIEAWIGNPWPIPGGYLIGALMTINMTAAFSNYLGGKWKLGIASIHLGIILLIVSCFVAGFSRHESQLWIKQDQSANTIEFTDESELVMIEKVSSGTKDSKELKDSKTQNKTWSISTNNLRDGEIIEGFPLPIKVLRILPNAQIGPREKNNSWVKDEDAVIIGTRGATLFSKTQLKNPQGYLREGNWLIFETAPTKKDNETNAVTAIIQVGEKIDDENNKKENSSEWIVSNLLGENFMPQTITVDGKTYEIALRLKRRSLPFQLKLSKFTFERYAGTDIPKNFQSDVEVVENGNVMRRAKISMNNPLRYGGYTFYQASFDAATESSTMLMTVKNPSASLPYFAVALVTFGLLWQFSKRAFRR